MFRRKLLVVFALTVVLSVGAVTWLVSRVTRRAFDRSEDERTAALVTEFHREFNRQGDVVARRVEAIASSDTLKRMAGALNRAPADSGPYFELAKTTADNSQLDFLEFVESDGTIISSAQWPSRFGYAESAAADFHAAANQAAFLKQEQLSDSSELGLFAVRTVSAAEHPIYVVGGRRLDRDFLSSLDMPAGMRVMLYQNLGGHFSGQLLVDPGSGSGAHSGSAEKLRPLIDGVRQSNQERASLVQWSPDEAADEVFHAIPLAGMGSGHPLLAILLIGNSRRAYVGLMRRISSAAFAAGVAGILAAVLLSAWTAARVTKPVESLAVAAQEVADGNWNARVEVLGDDELGQLADSFNRMTSELLTQKERLVQAERVAAWRELARRLAHELKNPLFPLQLTVENLVRARQQNLRQFDEIFHESARTLLAEIANLKGIVSRFSEFSTMPHPRLRPTQLNEVVAGVAELFQAQLEAPGATPIRCQLELDAHMKSVPADAELLHRAISNLVTNAIEAMPQGGVLTLRTRSAPADAVMEVSDTGTGLSPEECDRIFTPYYTSKRHGTGLGLAIVQSIVSDHGGRIRVQSSAQGTTFMIELPAAG